MILTYSKQDDGGWKVTGFEAVQGKGITRGEAVEDFLRKLEEVSKENEREQGYPLFYHQW